MDECTIVTGRLRAADAARNCPATMLRRTSRFLAMTTQINEFIIRGVTRDGQMFRPSDWAERLAGVMCSFGGGRLGYSPYCYPITAANVRCVVVDERLKEIEPMAYKFLLNFAKDNELETRSGRDTARDEAGSGIPAVAPKPV